MKQTNRLGGQRSGHPAASSPQMNRGAALLCLRAKHIVKDLTILKPAGAGAWRLVFSGLGSLPAIESHSTGAYVAFLWRWRNVSNSQKKGARVGRRPGLVRFGWPDLK